MVDRSDMEKILDRIPPKWGKYLSIREGWYQLVLDLDHDLAELDPHYELHQVKEKFGGLRYYAEMSSEGWEVSTEDQRKLFNQLISDAESLSYRTCETCGAPGQVRQSGNYWVFTACEEHVDASD